MFCPGTPGGDKSRAGPALAAHSDCSDEGALHSLKMTRKLPRISASQPRRPLGATLQLPGSRLFFPPIRPRFLDPQTTLLFHPTYSSFCPICYPSLNQFVPVHYPVVGIAPPSSSCLNLQPACSPPPPRPHPATHAALTIHDPTERPLQGTCSGSEGADPGVPVAWLWTRRRRTTDTHHWPPLPAQPAAPDSAFVNGFPVCLGLEPPSKLQARDREGREHEEGALLLAGRETTGQGAVPQRATSPERLCVASREPFHEVHRSPGSPRLGMVTWRSLETPGFRISFAMLPRDQGGRTQTQTENQEITWDSEPWLNPECPDRRLNHCRVCNDIALYKAQMWSLGEDDGHQWHPSSGLRPRISCPMCALPQKINFYVTFEPLLRQSQKPKSLEHIRKWHYLHLLRSRKRRKISLALNWRAPRSLNHRLGFAQLFSGPYHKGSGFKVKNI
ncbi:uncharacterized protein LOC131381274 [Hylobates moloch]|uniref:uncharacterized protein LOC131381274 n=1 Tax=Hylobates moloch TaxID=81572 RepID=UPI00267657D7|nr:uncharacterized protein LOC131381274 [Hylobates moloch]